MPESGAFCHAGRKVQSYKAKNVIDTAALRGLGLGLPALLPLYRLRLRGSRHRYGLDAATERRANWA
jgi:hypothetical protein